MAFSRHKQRRNAPVRRWFVRALLVLALALGLGEVVARYGIGLGDPPLFQADRAIEYLNKPGAYRRFHHNVRINRWSMRSPEFSERKTDSNELRILVFGDSVVHGGASLDDSQIATAILAAKLEEESGRPTVVANIAAGSWGPLNQLAYLWRFGTFDADAVLIVWSGHDAWDVPRFAPFGAENPIEAPVSALEELVTRYVLPRVMGSGAPPEPRSTQDADTSLRAARSLLEMFRARRIPVAVVLHATKGEQGVKKVEGLNMLRGVAESEGVPVFESATVLGGMGTNGAGPSGKSMFRDDIHPSADGQAALADLYFRIAIELLSSPRAAPAD